jgi:pimeloyl-ACP methyl ester carboxylesterase
VRSLPTTEFTTSGDGTRIAFDRRGAGPVLVLVDGPLSERRTGPMRPLSSHLSSAFTVVSYDRRGRGDSSDATGPVRGYRLDLELDDLRGVIAAVGGAAEVALHGVSTGALLAMHAVATGLRVGSISLFEPPFGAGAALGSGFLEQLTRLVEAGRRVEAVTTFQRAVGVPESIVATGGGAAFAPSAQTIVYDCCVTSATSIALARRVDRPVLVVESNATAGRVGRSSAGLVDALPHGEHVSLPGIWHGVPDGVLAPVLTRFHAR